MIKKILLLLVFLPIYLLAWKMESGTVSLPATTAGSSSWQTVTLQQTYDTVPLIFALPDDGNGSYASDSPAALRVQNIDENSFEIVQVEPQSNEVGEVEGEHAAMMIHYIAIESGDHTLPDGTRILANAHDTITKMGKNVSDPRSLDNILFSPVFLNSPIVLSMIQSIENEDNTLPGESASPWMTAHIVEVNSSSFNITLDRAETSSGSIDSDETIAYLAIDTVSSGTFYDTTCQSISYQTINTGDNVEGWDNGCYSQSFGKTYASDPNVIGSMQSRDGPDGGWLRRCNLSDSAVGIAVDEDQASDLERSHTNETVGLVIFSQDFVYDSNFTTLGCNLAAEYRMDECYWLGSSNFDVVDQQDGNNAEAYNNAKPDPSDAVVNFSGDFVSTGYMQPENTITLASEWTYSVWMKFPLDATDHADFSGSSFGFDYYFAAGSLIGTGELAAFALEGTDLKWAVYDETGALLVQDLDDSINASGWKMVTFVKKSDDSTDLYIDGVYTDTIALGTDGDLGYYLTSSDDTSAQSLSTKVDEVKLWNTALSQTDITAIYQNEDNGDNYNGTPRDAITCSASIAANTWEMIGIPVDPRVSAITIQDVFADDFDGSKYNIGAGGWTLWKKVYSDTNNSAHYELVDFDNNEELDFGRGYWLGSTFSATWDVEGLTAVNYDSTYNETSYCASGRCVEVDLNATSSDGSDGTGIRRFNLNGFIGVKPVEWADCHFIISDLNGSNEEVLTPQEADSAGYASSTISLWSGGLGTGSGGQVIGSDYTECTDTTPGGCTMQPFHGVWIELFTNTTGKKVKLLLPEESVND